MGGHSLILGPHRESDGGSAVYSLSLGPGQSSGLLSRGTLTQSGCVTRQTLLSEGGGWPAHVESEQQSDSSSAVLFSEGNLPAL